MSTERTPSGDTWPEGYERLILDSVDSTMAEARRRVGEMARPTWIMARAQTGGHGRRGAGWQTEAGNFAATLVMRPGGVAGWAALRSFMAANAVFETLALSVDRTRLAVKWPNDLLLDGGKVAGILLESASSRDAVEWLAIGVGVNLVSAPDMPGAAFPPIALEDGPDIDTFLTHLAGHYATEESILDRLGFAPIRENWLRKAARLGEIITARAGATEITGRFETVDEAGRLVLETPQGRRTIAAAEVYF